MNHCLVGGSTESVGGQSACDCMMLATSTSRTTTMPATSTSTVMPKVTTTTTTMSEVTTTMTTPEVTTTTTTPEVTTTTMATTVPETSTTISDECAGKVDGSPCGVFPECCIGGLCGLFQDEACKSTAPECTLVGDCITGTNEPGCCDVAAETCSPRGNQSCCNNDDDCSSLDNLSDCILGVCGDKFICKEAPAAVNTICCKAVGKCDLPEVCNGISQECPDNGFKAQGPPCKWWH